MGQAHGFEGDFGRIRVHRRILRHGATSRPASGVPRLGSLFIRSSLSPVQVQAAAVAKTILLSATSAGQHRARLRRCSASLRASAAPRMPTRSGRETPDRHRGRRYFHCRPMEGAGDDRFNHGTDGRQKNSATRSVSWPRTTAPPWSRRSWPSNVNWPLWTPKSFVKKER
jgi:hypothetical protein